MGKLDGKVAVVTGASKGMGRAIAALFAQEGADVAVVARTRSELETLSRKIAGLGRKCLVCQTDITKEDEVDAMGKAVIKKFDRVDILVNAAGAIFGRGAYLHKFPAEDWDSIFNLNIRGMFLCTKLMLKSMLERRTGQIINIASIAGVSRGICRWVPYAASKWAVVGFSKSLDQEVRRKGIKVSLICPGASATYFGAHSYRRWAIPGKPENRHLLSAEDVAQAALFIASQRFYSMIDQVIMAPIGEEWNYVLGIRDDVKEPS